MPNHRGVPQAQIFSVFRRRLQDLQQQAKILQNAIQGKHQRVWQTPSNSSGSVLDVPTLHRPAFDREEINAAYMQATQSQDTAGTIGDLICLKQQISYNSAEEQAYRIRHNTLARAMCLAHGRRLGQGYGTVWDPRYGVESAVAAYAASGGAAEVEG